MRCSCRIRFFSLLCPFSRYQYAPHELEKRIIPYLRKGPRDKYILGHAVLHKCLNRSNRYFFKRLSRATSSNLALFQICRITIVSLSFQISLLTNVLWALNVVCYMYVCFFCCGQGPAYFVPKGRTYFCIFSHRFMLLLKVTCIMYRGR